jgi:hypothetical protein
LAANKNCGKRVVYIKKFVFENNPTAVKIIIKNKKI